MKTVGIDPSINTSGLACIESLTSDLRSITVRTGKESEEKKLQRIYDGVVEFLKTHKPDKVGIEKPPAYLRRSKTSWRNLNAASIQKLNMAYGVILMCCADLGYTKEKGNLITISANAGLAKKKVAQAKVKAYWGATLNSHEADAAVVALYVLGKL